MNVPMVIAFGVTPGSDAGYWVWGSDGKLHHVGGWGITDMNEVSAALTVLSSAALIADRAKAQEVVGFAEKMLAPHRAYIEKAAAPHYAAAERV